MDICVAFSLFKFPCGSFLFANDSQDKRVLKWGMQMNLDRLEF